MATVPARDETAPQRLSGPVPHLGFVAAEAAIIVALAALTVAVKRHPGPLPGDVGVELDIQHAILPHHFLTDVVEAISTLNWPVPVIITLAIICALFLLLRRWLDTILTIATSAVNDGTGALLSSYVHRMRPTDHGIHILSRVTGSYSFPSGHTAHAMAVFGLFVFLTYQIRHPRFVPLIWFLRIVAAAIVVLMPISRITEGEHWPSDTLAGLLFGAFWLLIAAHVYQRAARRWPRLLAPDER